MSEPVLKAIIRLFALVASEDKVTQQERDYIQEFLSDHLNQKAIKGHLQLFDEYSRGFSGNESLAQEQGTITRICSEINKEIVQKQKAVIMLELMTIIMADGKITEREQQLAYFIGQSLNVSRDDVDLIQLFVNGRMPESCDHENILIVSTQPHQATKCRRMQRSGLDGFVAILYVKSADIYFCRYLGKTDVYLNGVPLKSGSTIVLATGSAIRWETAEPVYYGDVLASFKKISSKAQFTFEAQNIFYQFKNGKLGLREINIAENSGKLIALMGASGAGKSTLLHVLNGTEKPGLGKVLINGTDMYGKASQIEGIVGFVPQDDLLIEDLTVYQNLYFAARLCFSHLSEEEIDLLVLKTLDDLGLNETKDLKVGSPLRKTISGGQRKRLNIGLELLREPAVLFVDEPTSGLSSRDSENIIDLLKELSLKGKLVFAVIHQPSSDIFKMFDKLIILDTGGFQIYYGNPVDAVTYFKRNSNLVNSDQGECPQCGNVNPEQIFNIIETKVINEFGNFSNERKFLPEHWNQVYKETTMVAPVTPTREAPHSTLRIPGWLKQVYLFSLRDLLSKLSNKQYLVINLVEAPLLSFILAFIVRYYNTDDPLQTGYVFSKNLNLPAYFFMSVIVALFMGLTVSAEEIIRDRKILKRESFLHLSRSSYIVSKIGILFMISAIQTFLFVLVGNSILEIRGMFFTHWAILFTASCFANLLGLNISSAFNSAVTIYILIPILLIPQLILSGVVVKFDKLNPVIGNSATVPFVGDLMASRWAFEAAMVTQFKDNAFEKQFYLFDKIMAESDYKKRYYLPELESRLDFINLHRKTTDPDIKGLVDRDIRLVHSEIDRELDDIGHDNFQQLDQLAPDRFDSVTYRETLNFIQVLKKFYNNRFNKADQEKDHKISNLTSDNAKEKEFENFRASYQNEAIAILVKNLDEPHRIIEIEGKLVQKLFPVYKDPDPDHIVDFDAQFYMPKKHFLNRSIDTLNFNLYVIWLMSLVLAITLYFEILLKVIDWLGNLSNPVPKRM